MNNQKRVREIEKNLQGTSSEEAKRILNEIEKKLEKKREERKKENYERLFDWFLKKMKKNHQPEVIIAEFSNKRKEVIAQALKMRIEHRNIPFLPVIFYENHDVFPFFDIEPEEELQTLFLEYGVENFDYIDFNEITNKEEIPKKIYFIFNVECGFKTTGKTPEEATKKIKKEKRSCLTFAETISLSFFIKVLSKHFLDCTGSLYLGKYIPSIILCREGIPRILFDKKNQSNKKWGTPSCSLRK